MKLTDIWIYTVRMNDRLFYLNNEGNYSLLENGGHLDRPMFSMMEKSAIRTSSELSRRMNKRIDYLPADLLTNGSIICRHNGE